MKLLTIPNPVNLFGGPVAFAMRGIDREFTSGEELQLVDTKGQEIAYANVNDVWQGALGNVPAMACEMMQDPLCRSFSGLHTSLALRRENDQEQTPIQLPITVIIFTAKTSTLIRPTMRDVEKVSRGGSLKRKKR